MPNLTLRRSLTAIVLLTCGLSAVWAAAPPVRPTGLPERVMFVGFAKDEAERRQALALAESIREFAGAFRKAPIRLYIAADLPEADQPVRERLAVLSVEIRNSHAPADSKRFPYAAKVFGAAQAEIDAEAAADILVRMDPDTIVLKEPRELVLPTGATFGYRPVHHRMIGSPVSRPPDPFWKRIYKKLGVPESAIFPVVAPADGNTLRAYFNAGLVVVRPSRGVLRKWRDSFVELYRDPELRDMCRQDLRKAIFLHQAALAGAVLSLLDRKETIELPATYNYPLGLIENPDPLDRFVTIRYEDLFLTPGWSQRIRGPAETIAWLKARFPDPTSASVRR